MSQLELSLNNPEISIQAVIVLISCMFQVYTTFGLEVARVTVIDDKLDVMFDSFIKPAHRVLDYNTRLVKECCLRVKMILCASCGYRICYYAKLTHELQTALFVCVLET